MKVELCAVSHMTKITELHDSFPFIVKSKMCQKGNCFSICCLGTQMRREKPLYVFIYNEIWKIKYLKINSNLIKNAHL